MSSDQRMSSDQKMNLVPWSILTQNKTSCLTTASLKILASVCVFGRVSCLVSFLWHMPGRTTRRCKETLSQVKERLTREQANRISNRIRELSDSRYCDSDSDSEEEQNSSIAEYTNSLSELRRKLYLGLLCLWILIVLLTYWVRSISLRNCYLPLVSVHFLRLHAI
jgi:hypothetical protein